MLVERRFAFLRRFFTLRTVFMHLADGDAALALRAAGYVERVYTNAFLNLGPRAPANVRSGAPAAGTVDLAFGGRAADEVYRSLAPGGIYICSGPARATRAELIAAGFNTIRFYVGPFRVSYPSAALLQRAFEIRIAAVK
jgi:hypothetical protein